MHTKKTSYSPESRKCIPYLKEKLEIIRNRSNYLLKKKKKLQHVDTKTYYIGEL